MAHTTTNNDTNTSRNPEAGDEVKPPKTSNNKGAIFHDFLSKGCSSTTETSSIPKAGISTSSGASDLGTEKHSGNHFEGVPFYGPRGICTGPGSRNQISGTKRHNSDSFIGSFRENFPPARHESLENSHLSKFLRHVARDQPSRPHDEDTSFGLQKVRPISSKWDRAVPVNIGPVLQYPPRAGPSVVSQAAADEGSRTGMKGSGILSGINATAGGHGLASSSRQMTIFYGGQAHVFDNVHPNKADIIMSLASSNGGSWSTTYAPKLGQVRSSGEHHMPNPDNNETGTVNGYALGRESFGRTLGRVNSTHLPGSSDRIPTSTGIHQEIIISKETRGSNQGGDTRSKEG